MSIPFVRPKVEGYRTGLTEPEIMTLYALAVDTVRAQGALRYLEIGVWQGGTLKFVADHVPGGEYAGVDLFEDFRPSDDNTHISSTHAVADVQRYVGAGVGLYKGPAASVLPDLARAGRTFNFIFIDANHTYAGIREDFELSLPLLAPEGKVAFHNASPHIRADLKYVVRDGGPWRLTQELRRDTGFFLEAEVERVRVFSRIGTR